MAGLQGIGCHCWHWCRAVPCTAWPCFPCHQRGLPGVFPSQYPQCHLPAPHSPAALKHCIPFLLDMHWCGHQCFSISPHSRWGPLLPQTLFRVLRLLTQSPADPHLQKASLYRSLSVCPANPVFQLPRHPSDLTLMPVFSLPHARARSLLAPPAKLLPSSQSVSQPPTPTAILSPAHQISLSFLFQASHSPAAAPVFSSFQALLSSSSSNFSTSQTTLTHFPFHSLPHQFSHCSSRQFLSTDFFLSIYFASDPLHFPKTSCSCLPCYLNWVAYFSIYFSVPPQLSKGFTENIQYPLNLIFKCFFQGLQSTWNSQGKGHQNHSMWQNKKDHCFQNSLYKNL